MEQKIKWFTATQIVDVETGEILTKSMYERRRMRIINKTKSDEFKTSSRGEKYAIRTWTWECKEHEQLTLF